MAFTKEEFLPKFVDRIMESDIVKEGVTREDVEKDMSGLVDNLVENGAFSFDRPIEKAVDDEMSNLFLALMFGGGS